MVSCLVLGMWWVGGGTKEGPETGVGYKEEMGCFLLLMLT